MKSKVVFAVIFLITLLASKHILSNVDRVYVPLAVVPPRESKPAVSTLVLLHTIHANNQLKQTYQSLLHKTVPFVFIYEAFLKHSSNLYFINLY